MTGQTDGKSRPAVGDALAAVDRIDLRIEKLVAGGEGLGRYQGVPIFVPYSAPGDLLRVRIVERKAHYARGEILDVIEPAATRRTPRCRHFGTCGGCDLQHIEDGAQTAFKVEAVHEVLRRIGKIQPPQDVSVVSGEAWGYRMRTQLHTQPAEEGPTAVGYFARRSHTTVPIAECPVLAEDLERFVLGLPAVIGTSPPARLDVTMGDEGRVTCAPLVEGLPRGQVSIAAAACTYELDARAFFQSHRGLLPELIEAVVGPWEGETAVDLYAGVGLFTLPLAANYRRVLAVEGDRVSVRYGSRNARLNGRTNVEFSANSVESWIARLPEAVDRVVVDPPRIGLSGPVCRTLVAKRPQRITYVSCHPAALARDLARLQSAYKLEKLTCLDLFPQTGHLETVAQLQAG